MMRCAIFLLPLLLTACGDDFVPREKVATVDHETGRAVPPYPCPDWSQSARINWDNSQHSNYGCAVNNNLAVQLVDPRDLERGRGTAGGNTDMSIRTIERYRAGELPAALTPMQTGGTSQ